MAFPIPGKKKGRCFLCVKDSDNTLWAPLTGFMHPLVPLIDGLPCMWVEGKGYWKGKKMFVRVRDIIKEKPSTAAQWEIVVAKHGGVI